MRVAIVHDWLNQKVGGAENVLFELAKMYPDADIYTLVYNKKKFQPYLKNRKIRTSSLQHYPSFMKNNPKLLLPFIKRAVEKIDLSAYELVITSSSAWVKNVNVPKGAKHYCYCYSPARMLWDSWPAYIDRMQLNSFTRFYLLRLASKLRLWDYYRSQTGIEFIAISKYVAERIRKYYGQPSKLAYPPVGLRKIATHELKKQDYYLVLSVLSEYKNIDLALKAFKKSGRKLIIAGDGPQLDKLKKLAGSSNNIEFRGRVDEQTKQQLLQNARGFVFPSIEDFGITMVESIAAGTAVIALKGGGAEEIIQPNQTGIFFDSPDVASLNAAIDLFEKRYKGNYSLKNEYVYKKFSQQAFSKKFGAIVDAK